MSNMSYCMFENTVNDMQDILDRIWEDDFDVKDLSRSEKRSYERMHELLGDMLARFDDIELSSDEEE